MIVERRRFLKTMAALPLVLNERAGEGREVILCFDGCGPAEKWRRVHGLADRIAELAGFAHFTVYGCGAQLLTKLPGSTIGSGWDQREVDERIRLTQSAIDKGFEFGNHTMRHKNGTNWGLQQWLDELAEFDALVASLFADRAGKPYKPVGFRAPYLAINQNMYRALKGLGYIYDFSQVGTRVREVSGIIVKGLPLYERDNGKKIGGMDYNWHMANITDAELERMLWRYEASNGSEPLVISLHFSDLGHGSRNYFDLVSDFLIALAKKGSYRFISMIEHILSSLSTPVP